MLTNFIIRIFCITCALCTYIVVVQSECPCLGSSGNSNTCQSCYSGCWLNHNRCIRCPSNCVECTSSSACALCTNRYYGTKCQYRCDTCLNAQCTKTSCYHRACATGYYPMEGGAFCLPCRTECYSCNNETDCTLCFNGYYGSACDLLCDPNCVHGYCNKNTAKCDYGCANGFYQSGQNCLPNCQVNFCDICTSSNQVCQTCSTGYYLLNGKCVRCSEGCINGNCNKDTGMCTSGCKNGWTNSKCDDRCNSNCVSCDRYNKPACHSCRPGYHGGSCQNVCDQHCKGQTCDKSNGKCTNGCLEGYYQVYGSSVCARCPEKCNQCTSDTSCTNCTVGYHGTICQFACDPNCLHGYCNKNTAKCDYGCANGFYQSGQNCLPNCQVHFCDICTSSNQVCRTCNTGYYLLHGQCVPCSEGCINGNCNKDTGMCTSGCNHGWTNSKCDDHCNANCVSCDQNTKHACHSCKPGYHGGSCQHRCNTFCKQMNGVRQCAQLDGTCTSGCENGTTGATCTDTCNTHCIVCDQDDKNSCGSCTPGFYGPSCDKDCSTHCGQVQTSRTCSQHDGKCHADCAEGYSGLKCETPCETGCLDRCDRDTGTCGQCKPMYFGPSCEHLCNSSCYNPNNGSSVCDKRLGDCQFECTLCSLHGEGQGQEGSQGPNGTVIWATVGSVVLVAIVVAAVLAFIFIRRRRSKIPDSKPDVNIANNDAFDSVQNRTRDTKENTTQAESTALYSMPTKVSTRQPYPETSSNYQNSVYGNIDEMGNVQAIIYPTDNEEGLEEIDEDDVKEGRLTEGTVPKVDNYYNIYGLTRSRVLLDKLRDYVESKTAKDFEKEFNKLPQGLNRPYEDAVNRKNAIKNRYKGIYPYDATRVHLDGYGGDYINASYIQGVGLSEKAYIASLGPIDKFMKGYVDFWRMIWQEKVDKIVMLTNFVEGEKVKCDQYWPTIGLHKTYGDINVKCISVESFADFIVSKLTMKKGSQTSNINHFHFTAWPDRGTPDNAVSLVEFRESVEKVQGNGDSPTVVHCSAGIGRTGTYIALDILTQEGRTEGYVDIFGCVLSLRGQRVAMVQNVDQYRYLHHAMAHSLTTRCEQIESRNFCTIPVDLINEQFHLLKQIKDDKGEEEFKAIEKNSKEKQRNRKGADIPGDAHRPRLLRNPKNKSSDYINAVYVDSYKQSSKYLLVQTPLSATVEDFLGLILQENCSCIISLDDPNDSRKQDIGEYIPTANQELSRGKFKVKCTEGETTDEYLLRYLNIDVQGQGADETKTILHYQYHDWRMNSTTPSSTDSFLSLIRDTENATRETANHDGPVVVHCLTGAERSGLFPTVANLVEKVNLEQQASVVNVTRQIRARRSRAIPNKEQFHFSYDCVRQFIESSSLYSNVL